MAYVRRVPKFGFSNPFRVEYQTVNIGRLQELVDAGRLDASSVSNESLYDCGAISHRTRPVKILGDGELSATLTVTVDKITRSARSAIESAGGTIELHG